jgi:hypothetical protein
MAKYLLLKVWQSMAKYGKVWQSMAKYGKIYFYTFAQLNRRLCRLLSVAKVTVTTHLKSEKV